MPPDFWDSAAWGRGWFPVALLLAMSAASAASPTRIVQVDGGAVTLNAPTLALITTLVGALVSGMIFLHRSLMSSKDREIARVDADRKEQVERIDANRREEVAQVREQNRRLEALLFEVAERTDRAYDMAGAPKPPPATRRRVAG